MKNPTIRIDITKPRTQRPMMGLDIEDWRSELGLSKYQAQHALGFRNSNHYNNMCLQPQLPEVLELLIRIYDESPIALGWENYSLKELFSLMYGDVLGSFEGSKYLVHARVDLGTRFTKIFARSPARQYQWLEEDPKKNESELNAYSVIECILSKLKQIEDPKEVLERIARKVWLLRGVDLDSQFRVPSLEAPPTRQKTGRKSKSLVGRRAVVPVSRAKKLPPAANKAPPKKLAPKKSATASPPMARLVKAAPVPKKKGA